MYSFTKGSFSFAYFKGTHTYTYKNSLLLDSLSGVTFTIAIEEEEIGIQGIKCEVDATQAKLSSCVLLERRLVKLEKVW